MLDEFSLAKIEKEFLSILQSFSNPFEKFASRCDIRDVVDISGPHKVIDRKLARLLRGIQQSHLPKVQPLLGEAGAGKTHYFWTLADQEMDFENEFKWRVIYVPSPPMPIRIPLHFLTCLLDSHGNELVQNTAFNLLEKFNPLHNRSLDQVKVKVISFFGGVFSEIVKNFVLFAWPDTPEDQKILIKRWLFADTLEDEELRRINVKTNIENDDLCFAVLRIIDEFNGSLLIYFIDELELVYRMHGANAEIRLWEVIKKLFNESRNTLYITTCLLDVWDRVKKNLDASVISRFEPEVYLKKFSLEETEELYLRLMELFWIEYEFKNPPPNQFYPLNQNILSVIFEKSDANPRKILKIIGQVFSNIIDGEISPTSLIDHASEPEIENFLRELKISLPSGVNKSTQINNQMQEFSINPDIQEISPTAATSPENTDLASCGGENNSFLTSLSQYSQQKAKLILNNEEYYVKINPNSMISALLSIFKSLKQPEFVVESNYRYSKEDNDKIMPIILRKKQQKIGIFIPMIKDFGNLSKAKAYFYIIQLTQEITHGVFNKIVFLIPPDLVKKEGNLGKTLVQYQEDFFVVELPENDGKEWIENSQPLDSNKLIENTAFRKMISFIFPEIPQLRSLFPIKDLGLEMESKIGEKEEDLKDFLIKLNQ